MSKKGRRNRVSPATLALCTCRKTNPKFVVDDRYWMHYEGCPILEYAKEALGEGLFREIASSDHGDEPGEAPGEAMFNFIKSLQEQRNKIQGENSGKDARIAAENPVIEALKLPNVKAWRRDPAHANGKGLAAIVQANHGSKPPELSSINKTIRRLKKEGRMPEP